MTETAKTVLFVGAAALSLVIAFAMGPADVSENLDDLLGTRLNQFEVEVAKRLKIVKFDKETASTREFEVAENDGLWTIPSKQDYPADATSQMGEAATCLIDREVLRIAAKSAVEHKELGVVNPSNSSNDSQAEGVGTRVTMTDSNDAVLADMIIGKAVKDADGQHYVRNADQDVVYVVNLDPEKLSTTFDDWIEDDLLQLTPMDISRLYLEDYSAEMQIVMTPQGSIEPRVAMEQRGKMELTYDSDDSKWQATKLEKFDQESRSYVESPLAEDEEINEDALRELRNGLDDLLLVDVERKPEGLSSNLKASSDFLSNREAIQSLSEKGFIPIGRGADGEADIISSEGETICTLKDGVEYVLRFGNLNVDGESGEGDSSSTADQTEGEESDEESDDGFSRYLFVMARFNESMIEKPELEDLPELPEGVDAAEITEAEANDESSSEESSESESEAEDAVGETPQDTAEETEEQEEEEEVAEESAETASDEGETDSGSESDSNPAEESTAEESTAAADSATAEESTAATEKESAPEQSDEEKLADIIAQRKSIEEENQRKLNEYQDKLTEGRERVDELNQRFGDWYYVISNDVYKKIHLSREDVIKKKESDEQQDESADGGAPAGLPGLPNLPINPTN